MSNPATETIQPASHSNARSEFRLSASGATYTNLRLAGIGAVADVGALQYASNAGVYGLIQRAYLMDGGTVLDSLEDAYQWLGFSALRRGVAERDNGLDWSLFGALSGASRSWIVSRLDATRLAPLPTRNWYATALYDTTFQGWIALASIFNLCARLPAFSPEMFPALRLVIEWRTDNLPAIFAGDTSATGDIDILPPVLLADIVPAGERMPMPKSVVYNSLILEKLRLPGVAVGARPALGATVPVTTRVRLVGATGRVVNKLLLINVDRALEADTDGDRLKSTSSVALEAEVIQLSANGSTLLPYGGCDSGARKHSHLLSAWGSVNLIVGSQLVPISPVDGLPKYNDVYSAEGAAAAGRGSYGGFLIGRRIAELDIQHTRSLTNAAYSDIELDVYYETPSIITFGARGYSVAQV